MFRNLESIYELRFRRSSLEPIYLRCLMNRHLSEFAFESKFDDSCSIRHTIGVAAGKGGVGKSTVSVQLACALRKKGLKVGILDADVYGPSLRQMLPEDRLPAQYGEGSSKIFPASSGGIEMISMAFFRDAGEPAVVRAPIANAAIIQFLTEVLWGDLDCLIIDFPPGTGDIQLTLAQQGKLSGVVVVTTPQQVALLDVRKTISMLEQVSVPILGIVENMSHCQVDGSLEPFYPFGRGGGRGLSEERNIPFLGEIPLCPQICQSGERGEDLSVSAPFSEGAKAFCSLAENIYEILRQLEPLEGQDVKEFSLVEQMELQKLLIEWSDGRIFHYCLADLQRNCPCARCRDEKTGSSLVCSESLDPYVRARRVYSVGRYALGMDFSSGCSRGIYTFRFLREFGKWLDI